MNTSLTTGWPDNVAKIKPKKRKISYNSKGYKQRLKAMIKKMRQDSPISAQPKGEL